jgi:AhpD family alkylhydroperoxidase
MFERSRVGRAPTSKTAAGRASNIVAEGRRSRVQPRIEYAKAAPEAIEAMRGLDAYVGRGGLEPELVELVKIRASQINGCAYCIDMHTKDARTRGETEQRIYALDAWKETPFFTHRERAALAWTEAVTEVSDAHVPEEIYEQARRYFTEKELVDLTLAIVAINGWNRLAIGFRAVPGAYE